MRNYTLQPRRLPSSDAPVQLVAIVLVFSGQAQVQEQDVCKSTLADMHHPTDAWQRVFKPGHEILREGLPAPEV